MVMVMNPFNSMVDCFVSKSIYNNNYYYYMLPYYGHENRSFVKLLSRFAKPIVFKIPTAPLYNGIEIPLRIP
jgi:hypothetical protein